MWSERKHSQLVDERLKARASFSCCSVLFSKGCNRPFDALHGSGIRATQCVFHLRAYKLQHFVLYHTVYCTSIVQKYQSLQSISHAHNLKTRSMRKYEQRTVAGVLCCPYYLWVVPRIIMAVLYLKCTVELKKQYSTLVMRAYSAFLIHGIFYFMFSTHFLNYHRRS